MSFLNKNLMGRPSLVKPAAILIAVLLVIGGVYTFLGNKSDSTKEESADNAVENVEVKSSGIRGSKDVDNVADVEEVIAKWIEANPEAIIKSVQNMQQKAMADRMKDAQKNIATKKDELFKDKSSAQFSPSGYNVTIVEFFDYNCGYCKKAQATVEELLKEDKKVRIVFKEFPILGQASVEMSQVSIAVNMIDPSSYKKFHDALMTSNEKGKEGALKVAKMVGINMSKLESTLEKDKSKIEAVIQKNIALGSSIGVSGTPGFVIGEELIPGALELGAFKEKIAAVRK
jgi:protein-disulfide isomerase